MLCLKVVRRRMLNTSLEIGIAKLALAGEQAGFSLEQMIELLNEGLTVGSLIDLIQWRLTEHVPASGASSRWMA
jgi:hypothetical protein